MRKSRIVLLFCVVAIVGGSLYLWNNDFLFAKKAPTEELAVVDELYSIISQQSVYDTTSNVLVEGALRGMASAIKDPYSTYYSEQEAAIHRQSLASERVGIGVELAETHGKFVIVSPVKDSPAEQAGVRPLDEIVQIDDERLDGKTMGDVMRLMQGKIGQKVTLVLYRPQAERHIKLTIERAALKNETVEAAVIERAEESFGYLSLSMFGEKTAEEWKNAVAEVEKSDVQGWIVDVRDNPGGYLHSVAEIISTLENRERIFAYMQNNTGALEPLATKPEQIASLTKPIVILQNEGSASASEVFAAAMQAWERATIIGNTSFGKGTVQKSWELQNGGEVKLSTNKWLTPTKDWIHGKGVLPDIEVKQHPLFALEMMPLVGTFKQGDFSEEIAYVQNVLNELGYSVARQDGFFDEETAEVVQQFRKKHNLIAGEELEESFFAALQKEALSYKEKPEHDLQLEMAISFLLHELDSRK
ncbi:S41 family peptidase [Metasolibacillus sp. FSL H7-0170]|uniref:S41 family peptidase n=1 Tax=unclassified Metasolibacillus TaxID=2703679 RepID=UPI000797EC65|nr:peptidase S41 [[Bacillus] sp. KCTC 13219]